MHARPVITSSHSAWGVPAERLYHSAAYRWAYLLCAWLGVVVLSTMEPPGPFPLSALPYLRAADGAWLAFVAFDLGVQVTYHGWALASRRGWLIAKALVLLALVANLVVNSAVGAPYYARALRPLLLLERMRNVRKIFSGVIQSAPRVLSVLVLMVLNLMVFSLLGFLLFAGQRTGSCKVFRSATPNISCSTMLYYPDTCDDYFSTLGESTLHMFELMTAVNFPTVALPAMRCSRAAGVFFVAFTVVSTYLLFNLALAVAYAEFYTGMRNEVLLRFSRTFEGLDAAFSVLLDAQGGGGGGGGGADRVVAWGEGGGGKAAGGGGSGDDGAQQLLLLPAFSAFFTAFRGDMPRANSAELSRMLFAAFAGDAGGLSLHAFRRLALVAGRLHAVRDPSNEDVEDAFFAEESLSLEVFFVGHAAEGGAGGAPPALLLAPPTTPQVSKNPLAAAAEGAAAAAAAAAAPEVELAVLPPGGGGGGGGEASGATAAAPVPLEPPPFSSGRVLGKVRASFSGAGEAGGTRASSASVVAPGGRRSRGNSGIGALGSFSGFEGRSGSFAFLSDIRRQSFSALMELRRARFLAPPVAAAEAQGRGSPPRLLKPEPLGAWERSWAQWAAGLRPVVDSRAWEALFDASTLFAGLSVLIQLSIETDEPAANAPLKPLLRAMTYTQYATLAVGALCVAGRVAAWGAVRYWRRSQLNRFDLCVITATLLGTIVFNSDAAVVTNLWVAESLTFLRMLRLARVFRFLPGFSSTVLAFWDVVPLLGQYVLILLSSLFAFAVVGEHAFGGLLNKTNPRVAASSYGLYVYYDVVNFDSLPDAMFSVFYVLSVNDWVTLMEGCVAAVGLGARVYFIAFWPINVLFILNVLIAFITVAFGAEKERRDITAAALRAEMHTADAAGLGGGDADAAAMTAAARCAAPTFTVGVLDWRVMLKKVDMRGWMITRRPRFNDVYDTLYRLDVIQEFPATFLAVHKEHEEEKAAANGAAAAAAKGK
jgi:voltage-gated sodium channel